jgi:transposase-like protein
MKTRKNIEMIKKVKALRKKGLYFRQIARILEKDVKSIYRWYQYGKAVDK